MASLGSFKKGIVYTKGGLGQTGIALPSSAAPAATYLLDTYGGASAAYSVRKLSSTSTNSLRARRQHDSAELDIGFVGDTLDTAALEAFTNSIFENALEFDGVNDYVSFTAVNKPALTVGFSVSMWVKFNATPSNELILGNSVSIYNQLTFVSPTQALFRTRAAGASITYFNFPAISTGTWYYIAVSLVTTVNELWIDGVKYTGTTHNYDNENITFDQIGLIGTAYGQFIIDELALKVGSGLTQQDVDDLYNGGLGATATSVIASPNLYYKFNESGTDTTAVDASGNSNNGTLNNFPASGMWVSHPGGNYDAFVVTLYDQSGNGNDATNASAASQPQVVSSGVVITENGVTNLNFLSNLHKLRSSSASEFTGVTKFSGFNVGSFNTLNVGNQYISGVLINTNRGFKLGTEGSLDSMRFHYNPSSFGVINGGTLIANQQQLIAGLYDTNVGNAYINGTSVGSASVTITANTPNYYFIGYSFTSIGGAKKMQEAIFYPSYENANRADIEANINAYYSIYTSDAQAYITAAGITDPTEQAAVFQLVSDLKGTGSTTNNTDIWTGLDAIYPTSPTSLEAARYNLKDPAAYQITWYNSPTHSSAGVAFDGLDQYGDTGYAPTDGLQNDHSLGTNFSAYSGGNGALIGARTANSPNLFNGVLGYNNRTYYNVNASLGFSRSGGITSGHYIVKRNSSLVTLYKDTIDISRVTDTSTGQGVNNYMIGAYNFDSVPTFLASGTMNFTHIGASLTANQVTDLYDAITTYNTAVR